MKKPIKYTLISLSAAALLGIGAAGFAFGPEGHCGRWMQDAPEVRTAMRNHLVGKIGEELALDAAQRTRLQALAERLGSQRDELMADRRAGFGKVQALLSGERFDRESANALVTEKTGMIRDKAPALIAELADFYDTLRPDQQQKVRDWLADRPERRGFSPR